MKKITKFINQIIKDTKDRMVCDAILLMAFLFSFFFGIISILSYIGSLCNFGPNLDFFERGSWVFTVLMAIGSVAYIVCYFAKAVYSFILYLIKVWKSL